MTNKVNSRFWYAGLVATFIGNGIGRFGYITLIPVLIQANWFSKAEASQLGVATLIGYLFGPYLVHRLEHRLNPVTLIKAGMWLCVLSFLACSFQTMSFEWFYFWRLLAGLGGSMLMVLSAPLILPHVDSLAKGRTAGLIFSGIGLGAAVSGIFVPLVVQFHVWLAWFTMAALCFVVMMSSWGRWSQISVLNLPSVKPIEKSPHRFWHRKSCLILLIAYALNAIGFLPHTLFWVDYMVRELHFSLATGGFSWALFGLGAIIGPLIMGVFGDLLGLKKALLVCFFLKMCAVMLPLMSHSLWLLHASAFFVGMFTPGVVVLVSTYAAKLVGHESHRRVWGGMTFAFALTQAVAGWVMAWLVGRTDSYTPLFVVSSLALFLSFLFVAMIADDSEAQIT